MIKEDFVVSYQEIDAKMLSKMFLAGAKNLESKKEHINELNVFPVPDGDTGTNMTMTIMSAAKEVVALGEEPSMEALCKAVSSGSLRGARGNSGVILSQLFRGFTKVIKTYDRLNVSVITESSERAVETAYKAVMKPKEGTILTVAKGISEKARELADEGVTDLQDFVGKVLEHGRYVLSQTPELLPVLKQAGVVDSGGQGLIEVLSGAYDALLGKEVNLSLDEPAQEGAKEEEKALADLKFGYHTEFVILLNKNFNVKAEMDFKTYLESVGDHVECACDGETVKVGVNTNDPGLAIQKGLKFGQLSEVKVENLRLGKDAPAVKAAQKEAPAMQEKAPLAPPKKVGFIAISAGDGLNEIFKSIGVDYVIEGGQTMNPSTADILDAVDKVNAENIFVLPNNKNIILAARQAAELMTDKNLLVIPTKTIPQGITAVINYMDGSSVDENEEAMISEIGRVKTGQVTYAVRDTVIDDKEIKKDDYMGVGDNGILANGKDLTQVVLNTVEAMADGDCELISIYYGSDVTEQDAEAMQKKVAESYPGMDVELQYGGQPIYYYLISIE